MLHWSRDFLDFLNDFLLLTFGRVLFIFVVDLFDDGGSCLATTLIFPELIVHLRPNSRLTVHSRCGIALLGVIRGRGSR